LVFQKKKTLNTFLDIIKTFGQEGPLTTARGKVLEYLVRVRVRFRVCFSCTEMKNLDMEDFKKTHLCNAVLMRGTRTYIDN